MYSVHGTVTYIIPVWRAAAFLPPDAKECQTYWYYATTHTTLYLSGLANNSRCSHIRVDLVLDTCAQHWFEINIQTPTTKWIPKIAWRNFDVISINSVKMRKKLKLSLQYCGRFSHNEGTVNKIKASQYIKQIQPWWPNIIMFSIIQSIKYENADVVERLRHSNAC